MSAVVGACREPTIEQDRLAREVIGAAIEVHRVLGPGLLESVYERALAIELAERGVPFARQVRIELAYKSQAVGTACLDLVVGGTLAVELKSVECLTGVHLAQLLTYLNAGGFTLGLLINFNVAVLKDGIRRVVRGKTPR